MKTNLLLFYLSLIIGTLLGIYLIVRSTKSCNKFSEIINDLLKEKTASGLKYSQGRIYLLTSLLFYYLILSLMSVKAILPRMDMNLDSFEVVIESLQWLIALFAGYVFGSKGLDILDRIFKYKTIKKGTTTADSITNDQL